MAGKKVSGSAARELADAIRGTQTKTKQATVAYGTVTQAGEEAYVTLDGASSATPVSETAAALSVGDRVAVRIEGGSMAVTGNMTAPATSQAAVDATVAPAVTVSKAAQQTAQKALEEAQGRKVAYSATAYQLSADGTEQPTGEWLDEAPAQTDAKPYLWCRNTVGYADGTSAVFYSVTKMGSKGLKGDPGEDGVAGAKGADGKTSYLHIAYATSADGKSGFSTSDSTGKTYIGQYTDFAQADSTDPTAYAWTLIKGADGTGVSAITPQYYLSSSDTTQTGGSWAEGQPEWAEGLYIWERAHIVWTDGKTTDTEPKLAEALNGANLSAANAQASADTAQDTADELAQYMSFDADSGLHVGVMADATDDDSAQNSQQAVVGSDSFALYDSNGDPYFYVSPYGMGYGSNAGTVAATTKAVEELGEDIAKAIADALADSQAYTDGKTSDMDALRTLAKFFGYSTALDSLTIGPADSSSKVRITNNRISFVDSDDEIAYISGQQFYITRGQVTAEQVIGSAENGGGFAWSTRANGNMALKWTDL